LIHTFLVLVTVGLGHGVYRKLYNFIGGNVQRSLRTTAVNQQKRVRCHGSARVKWVKVSTLGFDFTGIIMHFITLHQKNMTSTVCSNC